jgi:uncharacterized protein (TIGR02466 family)
MLSQSSGNMPNDLLEAVTDMAKNGQLENVFSTPVFSHVMRHCDTLNEQLRELILEMERRTPGVTRSNQGGWQSPPDLFRLKTPPIAVLERYISNAVSIATLRVTANPGLKFGVELHAWAAVNRNGHYNTAHVHPMATWSGVYYVDPGDQEAESPGGLLEFVHPISASVMTFFPHILPSARAVQPKPGLLVLFPSYLLHNVRMYQGERPRISVPFNAHVHTVL